MTLDHLRLTPISDLRVTSRKNVLYTRSPSPCTFATPRAIVWTSRSASPTLLCASAAVDLPPAAEFGGRKPSEEDVGFQKTQPFAWKVEEKCVLKRDEINKI